MHPLLLIALAAGGWYVYQRLRGPAAGPTPPELPEPGPGPDGSGVGEVPTSPEGAANLAKWEALTFDVDVFPPGISRQTFGPPASESHWSVAPGCAAIAVGHGFWRRLHDYAKAHLDAGASVRETYEAALDELFSLSLGGGGPKSMALQCIDDETVAGRLFAAEIYDRIRFLSGPWISAQPQAPKVFVPPGDDDLNAGTWTKNPRMVDAIAHALTRGRR